MYLTDFGLALDKHFSLTSNEEKFFQQNCYFDYGEILFNLGLILSSIFDTLTEKDKQTISYKYNIEEGIQLYKKPLS